MDNLSSLSDELSDAICRLATGGCFRNRRLYRDADEEFFPIMKPVILNGIEELPTRGDLLSRSILLRTQEIESYDPDLESAFEIRRPDFFGAVLDALVVGIRELPKVKVERLPRMAEFARFGIAIEKALGYPEGSFMKAYNENLGEAEVASFEASSIAIAVYQFLKSKEDKKEWKGTALKLLQALHDFINDPGRSDELMQLLKHPQFPKTANMLSAELARVEPALKRLGVRFIRGKSRLGRFIKLELTPSLKSVAVPKEKAR